ncbi:hypothetical protein F5884DRAFT_788309 [Xylogone sp. PMI_703]|nr:hypothetical protein F5884DRAFT_788309 [Xylogone sp. PMI_703]
MYSTVQKRHLAPLLPPQHYPYHTSLTLPHVVYKPPAPHAMWSGPLGTQHLLYYDGTVQLPVPVHSSLPYCTGNPPLAIAGTALPRQFIACFLYFTVLSYLYRYYCICAGRQFRGLWEHRFLLLQRCISCCVVLYHTILYLNLELSPAFS